MFERELSAFAKRIATEVEDRVAAGKVDGGPYSENAFTSHVTEFLEEIGMIEAPQICHFEGAWGRGQAKIRINGFAMPEEEDRLDLFTTIYIGNEDIAGVPKEDIAKAAGRAAKFFEAACNGLHNSLEPASVTAELATRVQRRAANIEKVRVFVLTDGVAGANKVNPTEIEGTPVQFEVMDLTRLYKGMQSGEAREEVSIDFVSRFGAPIPCLQMAQPAEDYTAYLAIIPAEILYQLYDEFGPRLLELNVRSFLSARGKVNNGIRTTLGAEAGRFLAYNNGIVVTVDSLTTIRMPDGQPAIASVTGFQIVNGGQTTASIHRAKSIDKLDISTVEVPAKITQIKADKLHEMVGNISTYANRQNTVQQADFSANDPYHVHIEELASTVWCPGEQSRWFYERARGSYQVALAREGTSKARAEKFKERTPAHQRFTKTELAKYLNAWDHKPHRVSYGEQHNFNEFMQSLRAGRRADWTPDATYFRHLVAKAILWRATRAVVRQERAEGAVTAQPANATAYLVSYLSWVTGGNLNLEMIWQRQDVSPALVELLRAWALEVDKSLCDGARAKGQMVSEWAKREACWNAVKALTLPMPDDLPPEMAGKAIMGDGQMGGQQVGVERMGPEDFRNIEICKQVDGPTWLAIHAWGKKTGRLQKWQIGIAHTLASYAAAGWEKGPSPKQARHAVAMIDLARADGIEIPEATNA